MTTNGYSLETIKRIYDNSIRCYLEIGPDADGLDCLTLSERDINGNIETRITFTKEQARLICKALDSLLED